MSAIIPYLQPGAITNAQSDITDLQALLGMPDNSLNLGTFTGVTIPDSQTTKQALQSLETEVETRMQDVASARVGGGPGYSFRNLGDKITSADVVELSQKFSVSVDVFLGSTPASVSAPNHPIFIWNNNGFNSSSDGFFFTAFRRPNSGSNIVFDVSEPGLAWNYSCTADAETDIFCNLLFVSDGVGGLFVYQNGKLISGSVTPSGTPDYTATGTNSFILGRYGSQTTDFGNEIYSCRIFNRFVSSDFALKSAQGQGIGVIGTVTSEAELLTNGGFEAYAGAVPDDWTKGTAVTIAKETVDVLEGSNALEVTGAGAPLATIQNTIRVVSAFSKKSSYRIKAKVKRTSGSGAIYIGQGNRTLASLTGASISSSSSAGFNSVISASALSLGSDWYQVDIEVTILSVAANDSSLSLSADVGTVCLVDGVSVKQIGEILSWLPENASPSIFADSSGLGKNGTVTGATLIGQRALHADSFVSLTNLPTSSAGLATGRVWNDSGTLKIV